MKWIQGISPISFPSLGIDINPPEGISFGAFSIQFYGVILATGLLLACLYGLRRCKEFGLKQDDVMDGALITIPVAIICARLYYVAFSWADYKHNLVKILYIWEGGIAIYGAVIGAAVCAFIYCRCKKIPVRAALDITAISFLIGQAIGRWGNFMNREAFGDETASFLRMGLFLSDDRTQTATQHFYHPTFLYESLWNAAGFVLLHFVSKRRKYDGQMALGYAAWYGLGRCFIEGLRTDSLYWGSFRVSQMLAAISCFAAVTVLIILSFKEHDPAKLHVNRVAAMEAAAAEEEEGEWEHEEETEEAEETEESEEEAEEAEAEETEEEPEKKPEEE